VALRKAVAVPESETKIAGDKRLCSFVVVEPNRQMQLLLRTMLASYGIR